VNDSLDTSEDMARLYVGALPGEGAQLNPIERAVQLLREGAAEIAYSCSIDNVPDWANEPDSQAAHDEALMIARHLEALAPSVISATELAALRADRAERLRLEALINTPELENFLAATHIEAVHQVERWGTAGDRAKRPADWFWLVGYLAGKALHAAIGGNLDKAKHHCISTAAALYNWHCAIKGIDVRMCPGRSDVAEIVDAAFPGEAV
jgi:hypothetical protein